MAGKLTPALLRSPTLYALRKEGELHFLLNVLAKAIVCQNFVNPNYINIFKNYFTRI